MQERPSTRRGERRRRSGGAAVECQAIAERVLGASPRDRTQRPGGKPPYRIMHQLGMLDVSTPLARLRELLDSKSARDVARQVHDALEQGARSQSLPWEVETSGALRAERAATIPFGVTAEHAPVGAEAQVPASYTQDSSAPSRFPSSAPESLSLEAAPSILRRGPSNAGERELLAKLLAVSVIGDWAEDRREASGVVRLLAWLALRATIDAFPWLDEGLRANERTELWHSLAEHMLDLTHKQGDSARVEAAAAAWQISRGRSPEAHRVAASAAARTSDGWVRGILCSGNSAPVVSGELGPTPRGPVATFVLAATLALFVIGLVRTVGRYVFAYRRPTRLWIGPEGIEFEQRTELLGRVLRERRHLVALGSLSRITRETRFGSLSLYVGLAALAVGTFLGSGLLVDGIRAPGGSSTLLMLGMLCCLLGIGLDLGFSLLDTRRPNQCRVIVRPTRGRALCITRVDTRVADALLADVKRQLPRPAQPA